MNNKLIIIVGIAGVAALSILKYINNKIDNKIDNKIVAPYTSLIEVIEDTATLRNNIGQQLYSSKNHADVLQRATDIKGKIFIIGNLLINRTIILDKMTTFEGLMDSKAVDPISSIKADKIFNGTEMFKTNYKFVKKTSDLNTYIYFKNITLLGNKTINGLDLTNIDTMRFENSKIAFCKKCIITDYYGQLNELGHINGALMPGGLWVTNSLIYGIDINIEIKYVTQCWFTNNWFIGMGYNTCVRMVGVNKVKFMANEFNYPTNEVFILEDDSIRPITDVIAESNLYICSSSKVVTNLLSPDINYSKRIYIEGLAIDGKYDNCIRCYT